MAEISLILKLAAPKIQEGVSESLWERHKSKDNAFLHRSYSTKKRNSPKYMFSSSTKKFTAGNCWGFEYGCPCKDLIRKLLLKSNISQNLDRKIFAELEKIYFGELRLFSGYSFDVKNHYLLIYGVSRAF